MSAKINLKELERRAWKSVFQDGLWDIYLGLLLLAMAVGAWLSDSGVPEAWHYAIYATLMVLSMLVLWAGKRFITLPRMGRVTFGPKRKTRLNWVRMLLFISVLAGIAVFVIALAMRSHPSERLTLTVIFPSVWVVNVLVVFGLGAYFLDFNRLYLIGVMYALPLPLDIMFHELAGIDLSSIAFGVPAAVILIVGLAMFIRFLRDYPLPIEGALDANS
jgi:hypothetical protein